MGDLLSMKFKFCPTHFFYDGDLLEIEKLDDKNNKTYEDAYYATKTYSFSEKEQYEKDLKRLEEGKKYNSLNFRCKEPKREIISKLDENKRKEFDKSLKIIKEKHQNTIEKLELFLNENGIYIKNFYDDISFEDVNDKPKITYNKFDEDIEKLKEFNLNNFLDKEGEITIYVNGGSCLASINGFSDNHHLDKYFDNVKMKAYKKL